MPRRSRVLRGRRPDRSLRKTCPATKGVSHVPPRARPLFDRVGNSPASRLLAGGEDDARDDGARGIQTTGDIPPSTLIAVPVMKPALSEARKQAILANSSAAPMRPSAISPAA